MVAARRRHAVLRNVKMRRPGGLAGLPSIAVRHAFALCNAGPILLASEHVARRGEALYRPQQKRQRMVRMRSLLLPAFLAFTAAVHLLR
jgi:hypothetical protein